MPLGLFMNRSIRQNRWASLKEIESERDESPNARVPW